MHSMYYYVDGGLVALEAVLSRHGVVRGLNYLPSLEIGIFDAD